MYTDDDEEVSGAERLGKERAGTVRYSADKIERIR